MVKHCLLGLIFCLSIFVLQAQEENKQPSRWFMGLELMGNAHYRTIAYSANNSFIEDLRNKQEKMGFGKGGSINTRLFITPKWRFTIGFRLYQQGYNGSKTNLTFAEENADFPTATQAFVRYNSWELPIQIAYCVKTSDRWSFFPEIAFIPSLFRTQIVTTKTFYSEKKTEKSRDLNNTGYCPISYYTSLGFSAQYQVNKRFSLYSGLQFQHGLNNMLQQKNQREVLYGDSWFLGVNWGF